MNLSLTGIAFILHVIIAYLVHILPENLELPFQVRLLVYIGKKRSFLKNVRSRMLSKANQSHILALNGFRKFVTLTNFYSQTLNQLKFLFFSLR